jgi:RND family efflux transporter MFP subunit
MKQQLALWKQIAVIAVIATIGYGVWHQRDRLMEVAGYAAVEEEGRPGRRGRGGGDDAVPVIVETVRIAKAVDEIRAIGNGRANRSVTLYPEVSGIIASMDAHAGDRVEKGKEILRLDDRKEKIAVSLAEAKLSETEKVLKRAMSLVDRRIVSQATVDTAQTARDTAQLELQQAKQALADRTIRAPFAGVLGIPSVEFGNLITPTSPIVTLDDRSVIIVEFDIAEGYLNRLKPGQQIEATNSGFRGQTFTGTLKSIDSRIDQTTRTVRLRAEFPNKDDLLRSGMSFIVTVKLEGQDYPSIDELALRWEREGAYVWRIVDEKADKVSIELIKRRGGRVLVAGELKEGELIAVEGTQRLRPGRQVRYEAPSDDAAGRAGL